MKSTADYDRVYSSTPETYKQYFDRLWVYRFFIYTLIRRDLKIRFANTFLGSMWLILNPLIIISLFGFFFSYIIPLSTGEETPIALFILPAWIVWIIFSKTLQESSIAIRLHAELIQKLSFPLLSLIIARCLIILFEVSGCLLLYLFLCIYYQYVPSVGILVVVPILLLTMLFGLSISIWIAQLSIYRRDIEQFIPYFSLVGFWITPIFFSPEKITGILHSALYLNPLSFLIGMNRWAMLDSPFPPVLSGITLVPFIFLLLSGLHFFIKSEKQMPENL